MRNSNLTTRTCAIDLRKFLWNHQNNLGMGFVKWDGRRRFIGGFLFLFQLNHFFFKYAHIL